MGRRAGDVGMPTGGQEQWPPEGQHLARCVRAERWKSPKKKTAAVRLFWETDQGHSFSDPVFVTPKTVPRLNLVAQHVCGLDADTLLPDDDAEAAKFLARYILDHAAGKQALVTVQADPPTQEDIMQGRKHGKYHRVAFAGYERCESGAAVPPEPQEPPSADDSEVDDIPF